MLKYQRNFRVEFEIQKDVKGNGIFVTEKKLTVAYPFTINFTCEIKAYSKSPQASIQLFNLNETTRNLLWKDQNDQTKRIVVYLYAGYGQTMPLLFQGIALWSYSYKDGGSTDFITAMEVTNETGWNKYGYLSYTFQKGTKMEDVINTLCQHNGLYSKGYISADLPPLKSSQTYCGNMLELLRQEFLGYKVYVDKGKLYVLKDNEVVPATHIQVITAETGLLGTPKRSDSVIIADLVFEPDLHINQALRLKSSTMQILNNDYMLVGLKHSGTISPSQSGELITTITLSLTVSENLKTITLDDKPKTESKGSKADGKFLKPINGIITSPFGWRLHPIFKTNKFHNGIDIAGNMGTPVKACNNGRVAYVGTEGTYGQTVHIDHGTINGKRVRSKYSHMSGFNCQTGKTVSKGDTIGYVGSTGLSNGPHLHLRIEENGQTVNPVQYIGG